MKRIITAIIAVIMSGFIVATPVFADSQCTCPDGKIGVKTAILGEDGCSCDSGNGESILRTLKLVVDILSVGVGILGVIGITIVGIQYLTAGGNEEQTRKAKRRLFEIILGLVVYVAIYAILQWLMPSVN